MKIPKIMNPQKRNLSSGSSGMTLTELLVVMAVIIVLALIVIPATFTVRTQAMTAGGASTMRGIGNAVLLYMNDNDNYFPGPLNNQQHGVKRQNNSQIATRLAPYFEAINYGDRDPIPAMIPPAFEQKGYDPFEKAIYFMNVHTRLVDGSLRPPWGYPGREEHDILNVLAIDEPSTQVMMIEMDAQFKNPDGGALGPGAARIPEPLHGQFRFGLFYDGHVERIPLDKNIYASQKW